MQANTLNKLDVRTRIPRLHRNITLTLKFTTIDRLKREVQRGSWSALTDQAINAFLDKRNEA
jgi:hypothetical protein